MPADNTDKSSEAETPPKVSPPLAIPEAMRLSLQLQIALSFIAFVLIGANDGALGVLLPSIQDFYNIDKATVSLMFVASVSGYLLSAFSSGLLVDKLGRRTYMLVGTASFALGISMLAFAMPFPVVVVGSIFSGFGVAIIDAGLNAYIAGLPNSTSTLNYLHAFFGIGAFLGPLVATGVLKVEWPWNAVYYLWVAFTLILFFGFMTAFKDDHVERPAAKEGEGNVMKAMLKLPVVWLAAIFLFLYVGLEVGLGTWAYSFLTEERRDPTDFSGLAVGGYWLGLTLGRVVMGALGARLGNKQLINLCLAGTVAGSLIVWLVHFAPVEAFGLFLIGFSLGPIFPTTIALMSNVVSARLLPGVIGFMAGLGAMGAAIFPASIGVLAELIGLWSLLPYEIILAALLVVIWFRFQAMAEGPGVNRKA